MLDDLQEAKDLSCHFNPLCHRTPSPSGRTTVMLLVLPTEIPLKKSAGVTRPLVAESTSRIACGEGSVLPSIHRKTVVCDLFMERANALALISRLESHSLSSIARLCIFCTSPVKRIVHI